MFDRLSLDPVYSSFETDIVKSFYEPVLSNAVSICRVMRCYSFEHFVRLARSLDYFSNHGQHFRILLIDSLSSGETMITTADDHSTLSGDHLIDVLGKELSPELEKDLANFAFLLSSGIIEVRIASLAREVFLDPFAIVKDIDGNTIDIHWDNENKQSISADYEAIRITCDWLSSGFDKQVIYRDENIFNEIWESRKKGIVVSALSSQIKDAICKLSKGKIVSDSRVLNDNCVVLDLSNTLEAHVQIQNSHPILYGSFFKLHLKRFASHVDHDTIFFRSDLSYVVYKKIIARFRTDSASKGYALFVTDRLQHFIDQKEMYIQERSRIGMDIKHQSVSVAHAFDKYRHIVDDNMARKLREKQMWDSFFMYTMKKAGNFSVPGSGKTASVLGVFAYLHACEGVKRIIMVGPKNSFESWENEFLACFGDKQELRVFSIQDKRYTSVDGKRTAIRLETGDKNLLLFNYESLSNYEEQIKPLLGSSALLVFDEVHKVKAVSGEYAKHALELAKEANHVIILTGTPIPNSYTDLYNPLHILFPYEYDEFFGYTPQDLRTVSDQTIAEINSKIQPFFCRTTKDQLMVPKANDDILLRFDAAPEELRLFRALCLKYKENPFALIIRLLQLESDPELLLKQIDFGDLSIILDGVDEEDIIGKEDIITDEIKSLVAELGPSTKRQACVDLAAELADQGKSIIIWCIFIDSIRGLQEALEGIGFSAKAISGATPLEARTDILEEFRHGGFQILLTNPHTLAESVSLHTICHDAIYFEYSYNLVHLLQSKDRIHRLGLPDGQYTQYYFLQESFTKTDGNEYSLDGKIYQRLKEKEQIMLDAIETETLEHVPSGKEDLDLILGELLS